MEIREGGDGRGNKSPQILKVLQFSRIILPFESVLDKFEWFFFLTLMNFIYWGEGAIL